MSDSLIVKLGADTSEFRGQIASATNAATEGMSGIAASTERPKSALRELTHGFRQLKELFFVGGGLHLVLNWFDSLAEKADKSKDLIDSNVESTRRWGEEWKDTKNIVSDWGIQVLGTLSKIGRATADFYTELAAGAKNVLKGGSFVDGFTKAKEEIEAGNKAEEETALAVRKTIQAIKEANDHKSTSAAIEHRIAEERRKQLENAQAVYEFDKEMEALDEKLAKSKYDLLKPEAQLLDLQMQRAKVQKEINDTQLSQEHHKEALIKANILDKDISEKTLEIEKARTEEMAKQEKARMKAAGDLGVAKSIGGFQTYNDPTQQQAYEKQLLASARKQIDDEISALRAQVDLNKSSGSSIGKFDNPALQARISALQARENHLQDYVFNPRYKDAAGAGIFAQQVSTIGDPLKLQTQANDTLSQVSKGVSDLNNRLRVAGFGTGG